MLRYDGRRHTCACGWAKIQRFPSLKYSQKCRVRMRRRCFHARTRCALFYFASVHYSCHWPWVSAQMYTQPRQNACPQTRLSTKMSSARARAPPTFFPPCLFVFARAYCEVRFKKLETITVLTFAQTEICLYHSGGIKQPFLMVALKCIQVPPLLLLRVRPSVTMRP